MCNRITLCILLLSFAGPVASSQEWTAPQGPPMPEYRLGLAIVDRRSEMAEPEIDADTIRVPYDYASIQEAVYHASFGTVVYVAPGIYEERIALGRGIILQGANHNDSTSAIVGFEGPIIQGADSARISGFIISNRTGSINAAPSIYATNTRHFVISNNILLGAQYYAAVHNDNSSLVVENNYFVDSFQEGHGYNTATYSAPSLIRNNWFLGTGVALQIRGEDFASNNVIANCGTGFIEYGSAAIRGNTIVNCIWGLFLYGHGDIQGNTILFGPNSSQMGIGVEPGSTTEIHENTLAGGSVPFAAGFRGSHPIFRRNRVSGTFSTSAIYCLQMASPDIVNNTVVGGKHGIYLDGSSSPLIKNNILAEGDEFGVYASGGGFTPAINYNDIAMNGTGMTFNVPVGPGNISDDPMLVNPRRFLFADGAQLASNSRIRVSEPALYQVGSSIELDDDEVLRTITAIAGDTLNFTPPLASDPKPLLTVLRNSAPLAVVRYWSDDTSAVEDYNLKAGSPCIDAGDPGQTDQDGSRIDIGAYPFSPITAISNSEAAIQAFELLQNYPNPFNPSTTIEFSIPHAGLATLKVFSLLGREVETLIAGELSEGRHSVNWIPAGRASGIYFYRLQAVGFVQTRKLILLR